MPESYMAGMVGPCKMAVFLDDPRRLRFGKVNRGLRLMKGKVNEMLRLMKGKVNEG